MRPNIRKILTAVLAVIFVFSGAQLIVHEIQNRQGRQEYDEAAQLAGLTTAQGAADQTSAPQTEPSEAPTQADTDAEPVGTEPTAAPVTEPTEAPSVQGTEPPEAQPTEPATERPLDLAALQAVNADVIGWISIPDTILSYPLLQADDNDYYLKRTWKKEYNPLGSIYLDYRNDPALTDPHTIIYGHRMRYDDMFGSLRHYKKQSYWEAHPEVQITTAEGVFCYQIFAAYEVDTVTGHVYQLGLTGQAQQDYVEACLAASVIDTGIVPAAEDPIITLSTCTAQGSASRNRWVVQAVLKTEE